MTRSLRILAVADVSALAPGGGAERVLWEQAVRLAARGHRVGVVGRAAGAGGQTVRGGVRIEEFAVDRRSLPAFVRSSIVEPRRRVARWLAREGADVLHLHQPLSGWGVLASEAGRRLPSLYTFHSPAALEYRSRRGMTSLHRGGPAGWLAAAVLRALERRCVRRATRVHVLSEFSAGLLGRLHGVSAGRLVRIPGGADPARFRPAEDRAAVRRALGLPEDAPLCLTVRNLEARMGLDVLLRAVARLRARRPVHLVIGGRGSRSEALAALARALDLGDAVRFTGWIAEADLPRYYQAADWFVLPTQALEGFGLVTVEALACGTPVVGTPVGATPEVLGALPAGLLLRDASAEALADGLDDLLARAAKDPDWYGGLRAECRRLVAAAYTWDGAVARLDATLAALVGTA